MSEASAGSEQGADRQSGAGRMWRRLWEPPDPQLADAGFASEVLIAGIRLLIASLLVSVPLERYAAAPSRLRAQILLGVAGMALLQALLIYSAVRRNWGRAWIGFVSSILDVSLVSAAILLVQVLGATEFGPLLFPAYFLAIGATSLRYDARICLASGAAMVIQYSGLAAWMNGGISWGEVARVGLLVVATVLASTIVFRARELRRLSISDRLTGLSNRGYFDERLREEGAAAQRARKPVTVVMIDIDHFKQFNDRFGHRGGDEALCGLARLLRQSFRATDVVARYGGEEIALVLPGMEPDDAVRRTEDLRRQIEAMDLSGSLPAACLTVSIGVATWPEDGGNLDEVLRRADERLYRAKALGRNRVIGPPTVATPGFLSRSDLPTGLA